MQLFLALPLLAVLGLTGCASRPTDKGTEKAGAEIAAPEEPESKEAVPPTPPEPKSAGHVILCYVPNRLFDLLDIARLRVRVGPGVAVGARVTTVAEVYLGTYASVYAGLPGPRRRPAPKLPVGLESYNGAAVSVLKGTFDGGMGPEYSPTEVGLGVHPLLIGVDFGLDPWEVVDLFTGLVTLDVRQDSL